MPIVRFFEVFPDPLRKLGLGSGIHRLNAFPNGDGQWTLQGIVQTSLGLCDCSVCNSILNESHFIFTLIPLVGG